MEIILYVARQIKGIKRHLVLRMCTHISHEPVDIDLFCAADPKEAITFLEKTKEKVSPQNTTSKILAKKYCFMTEGLSRLLNPKVDPWMFCVCF